MVKQLEKSNSLAQSSNAGQENVEIRKPIQNPNTFDDEHCTEFIEDQIMTLTGNEIPYLDPTQCDNSFSHLPYRIINISSTAGRCVSTVGGTHYTASKAAVLGITRSAAKELAHPYGITVNAIAPGAIRSDMFVNDVEERQKLTLKHYEDKFPIRRMGE